MIEEFRECLNIILLHFIKFIQNSLFFSFILGLDGGVFENVHNDTFWMFFKEDIADANDAC
jgi:hypothetical protein